MGGRVERPLCCADILVGREDALPIADNVGNAVWRVSAKQTAPAQAHATCAARGSRSGAARKPGDGYRAPILKDWASFLT